MPSPSPKKRPRKRRSTLARWRAFWKVQGDTSLRGAQMPMLQVIRRVAVNYTLPYWRLIAASISTNMVVAGVTALSPWVIQQALDNVLGKPDARLVIILPLAIAGAMILKGVSAFFAGLALAKAERNMIFDMRRDMFRSFVHADLAVVEASHAGMHMTIFTQATSALQGAMGNAVVTLTRELFTILALIGVMFYMHVQFAIICTLLILPITFVSIRRTGKAVRRASKAELSQTGHMVSDISDMLTGLRIIKAFGLEKSQIKKNKTRSRLILERSLELAKVHGFSVAFIEALSGVAIAVVVFYGGILSLSGQVTTGQFVGFISALLFSYKPLKALTALNLTLANGLVAGQRVFQILDAPMETQDEAHQAQFRVGRGEVRFDNVTFAYPGQKIPAVRNISFTVPGGKRVALVGASGAGKSTMMNLVPRFFIPQKGRVLIDGQDTTGVTAASLRQAMALVTQNPFLFDDTVANNILAGAAGASPEEVKVAAKAAAAHDFIAAMKGGYKGRVGPNGHNLSGGERQRLAIARAMLRNAPLLLLDEATSSLDNVSEEKIRVALARLLKGRTSLIIAHRLSTIIDADLVIVLDHGRLVQSGTHSSLLAQDGVYRTLFYRQFYSQALIRRPTAVPKSSKAAKSSKSANTPASKSQFAAE